MRKRIMVLFIAVLTAAGAAVMACNSPTAPDEVRFEPSVTPPPPIPPGNPSTEPDARISVDESGRIEIVTRSGQRFASIEEWQRGAPDQFSGRPVRLEFVEMSDSTTTSSTSAFDLGLSIDSRVGSHSYPSCAGCAGARQVKSLVMELRAGGSALTVAVGMWAEGRRLCLAGSAGSISTCGCYDGLEELLEKGLKTFLENVLKDGLKLAKAVVGVAIKVAFGLFTPNVALAPPSVPGIADDTLPRAVVGQNYDFSFNATGGTTPYSWTVTTGRLPAGLQLSKNGRLAGTALTTGFSDFEVCLGDALNLTALKKFQLEVASSGGQPSPGPLSLTGISPAPRVTTTDASHIFAGSNLVSITRFDLVDPGGRIWMLSGPQLTSKSPTAVSVIVTFGTAGTWRATAVTSDGQTSNVLTFTVESASVPTVDPNLTGITPAPQVTTRDAIHTFTGSNLADVTRFDLMDPSGRTWTLSGSQLTNRTATGVTVLVTFGGAGAWRATAVTSDGRASNVLNFSVASAPSAPPSLTGITPPPQVTARDVVHTFTGSNLADVTGFDLMDPTGQTWTLSGSQLTNRTATGVTVLVTFGGAGTWRATAITNDGRASNVLTFSVASAPSAPPSLTGITPAPQVTTRDAIHTFTGSNLADVTRFDLMDPSGRTWTLSGTQLMSRTATGVTVLVTFGGAGTWRATAVTTDGRASNMLTFNVASAPPSLTGITPPPQVTTRDVVHTFTGSNLADVTRFDLMDPSGRTWGLSGTQLTSRAAMAVTVLVTFGGSGTWRATAISSDGRASNALTFSVAAQ